MTLRGLGDPPLPNGSDCLDAIRDELLALPAEKLIRVNTDIPSATTTVIAMAREVRAYRPALVTELGEARAVCFDRLEQLAAAALRADVEHRVAQKRVDLEPMRADLSPVREILLSEVRTLILRKVLDPGVLGELCVNKGNMNMVVDVLQLVSIFQLHAEEIGTQTSVTTEDLELAETKASALAEAISLQEQGARGAAADLRERAYSLLWHTYDDARRCLTFLRWKEGDYDRLAPSFCANRRRRRRGASETDEPGTSATEEASPIRPGMPGGNPFEPAAGGS